MALFGLFSKDTKGAVEKHSKRLMNKYTQTADRLAAIDSLTKIGTEDAIAALLKRYQFRVEQSIADEDEKQQVYSSIVGLGDKAVHAIVQYIGTESGTYWPIKALRALAGDERTATHVIEAFDGITNSYGQNRERRQQLVDNLRNFANIDFVFDRLVTLVRDEDEEVVIRAVDGLSAREGRTDHVEGLFAILVDEATSVRVRMMIFEIVVDQGWTVAPEQIAGLAAVLPPQYTIDAKTGKVSRR